ncbi:MAG TPA: glycosyltransferase [Chloroflexota bacterium]|nr:glycosyltransferase [Chloroflexota bacterium]
MRRLKIFTWHVHGSYLYYLAHLPHDFYLPVKPGRPEGYGGRSGNFLWPTNVHDVPAERVRDMAFDVIMFQSTKNYVVDQFEILSPAQRELPAVYLEHNTPRPNPTDTRHPVDDPRILLVHCTYFNAVMWDNGRTPTMVIPHGVVVPDDLIWTGKLDRGIVVVNDLHRRGRLAGLDIFLELRQQVPLDLAGMDSKRYNGLGDLPLRTLHQTETRYRFFFNPIRYTSMPLSVVEAMAIGLPIVALATTELPRSVPHGEAGIVSNNRGELVDGMQRLCRDLAFAKRLGIRAREIAREAFGIERFMRDWNTAFDWLLSHSTETRPPLRLPRGMD